MNETSNKEGTETGHEGGEESFEYEGEITPEEALYGAFPPEDKEEGYQKAKILLEEKDLFWDPAKSANKYVGMPIVFVADEIGVREYSRKGQGAVHVLDKNSSNRINVAGHVFKWISITDNDATGLELCYEDMVTGKRLILTLHTHVAEFLGSMIKDREVEFLSSKDEIEEVLQSSSMGNIG